MWRALFLLTLGVFLQSCSSSVAPNGMSWSDYHAAQYNLTVTYVPEAVYECQELGEVKGVDYFDMGSAKEVAEEAAVLLGGNFLLYQNLWSERRPGELLPNRRELYHADGMAFRCLN